MHDDGTNLITNQSNKLTMMMNHDQYRVATVIEGEIIIDDIPFKQGDHFIVTSTVKQFTLCGLGWIIFANIP
jgi:mannose-6-phosphate isomerase class I